MVAIVCIIALHYVLFGAYILMMNVQRLRDSGVVFTQFWGLVIWPWAFIGVALDMIFNVTVGSVMFLELPREAVFTSRLKRLVNRSGWRGRLAAWWKEQLNQISPGHV